MMNNKSTDRGGVRRTTCDEEQDGSSVSTYTCSISNPSNILRANGPAQNGSSQSNISVISTAETVDEGEELVLDGVIVSPESGRKWRTPAVYCFFLVSALFAFYFMLRTTTLMTKTSLPEKSVISFYDDYMRQVILPITEEAVLDDDSSIQHLMWKVMGSNLPVLLNASILSLNDVREFRQRYITGVVQLSMIGNIEPFREILLNAPASQVPTCDIHTCNESGEITTIILKNRWSEGKGGGTIAKEIGELKGLKNLVLSGNALRGTIPTEINKLKNLHNLDLHDNYLSGAIPTIFGQLEHLEVVIMNRNSLENAIPTEIGNLSNLFYIDFSQNRLTGTLPSEFHNLHKLEGLAIWNNSLSGSVDFLCDFIVTEGDFSIEISTGVSLTHHIFSGELGVTTTSCDESHILIECSCCRCAI